MDEDDIVAIASRNLIDRTTLFNNERILDVKTKAIPEGNDTALTTIIMKSLLNLQMNVEIFGRRSLKLVRTVSAEKIKVLGNIEIKMEDISLLDLSH